MIQPHVARDTLCVSVHIFEHPAVSHANYPRLAAILLQDELFLEVGLQSTVHAQANYYNYSLLLRQDPTPLPLSLSLFVFSFCRLRASGLGLPPLSFARAGAELPSPLALSLCFALG